MVQSLLDLHEKKSFFDILTLLTLLIEISLLFILPRQTAQYFFLFLFLFWRLAYNVGLGILLKNQSESRNLVRLAKKYKIFDDKSHPKLSKWLKVQLSTKMGPAYNFHVKYCLNTIINIITVTFYSRLFRLNTILGCYLGNW